MFIQADSFQVADFQPGLHAREHLHFPVEPGHQAFLRRRFQAHRLQLSQIHHPVAGVRIDEEKIGGMPGLDLVVERLDQECG